MVATRPRANDFLSVVDFSKSRMNRTEKLFEKSDDRALASEEARPPH